MATQAYQKRSFTVRWNRSISGTFSFLNVQFVDIPRSAIYVRRGLNYLSACMGMVLSHAAGIACVPV